MRPPFIANAYINHAGVMVGYFRINGASYLKFASENPYCTLFEAGLCFFIGGLEAVEEVSVSMSSISSSESIVCLVLFGWLLGDPLF